jgi:osmotically inducible protein OsmC
MADPRRTGSARWSGDLAAGSGRLTVGRDAWSSDYSLKSRFADGAGTNPEELIAAAHAACFSMALSHVLAESGHPPRQIATSARVHLRNVDGLPTIARIDLETEGDVPGIDAARFAAFAEQAKSGCAVSRALGGVVAIELAARYRAGT